MALPELVKALVEKKLGDYCEEKIPEWVRDKVKINFKLRGNSVTLVENRPFYMDPNKWTESVVAQFRYNPHSGMWTLYCADRNGRWHLYDYAKPSKNFDAMLEAVEKDRTGIFWG